MDYKKRYLVLGQVALFLQIDGVIGEWYNRIT